MLLLRPSLLAPDSIVSILLVIAGAHVDVAAAFLFFLRPFFAQPRTR